MDDVDFQKQVIPLSVEDWEIIHSHEMKSKLVIPICLLADWVLRYFECGVIEHMKVKKGIVLESDFSENDLCVQVKGNQFEIFYRDHSAMEGQWCNQDNQESLVHKLRVDKDTQLDNISELYEKILFHENKLKVLKRVTLRDPQHASGFLFSKGLSSRSRVALLDGGLQLLSVWIAKEKGVLQLPTGFEKLSIYHPIPHLCQVDVHVVESGKIKTIADIHFFAGDILVAIFHQVSMFFSPLLNPVML